ncbi:beta-N-acetylhexosaminidase [Salirhabdus euzebyi]|uniref:Beta-N-acetylhexosaminidase n=1 Tax=Salirhabdus euzebyi TaxID=394506 RepID=A0A841Q675_9BACI|nr:beta-N-acetylhexosaminidase [Salirhabdus euzebyi]MBB6453853.1 beta-N-acetylhexosaminidase [Salirhabdus euzebyi]
MSRRITSIVWTAIVFVSFIGFQGMLTEEKKGEEVKEYTLEEQELDNDVIPVSKSDTIAEQLQSLSLEQKIGQLFMVGIEGQTIDSVMKQYINDYYVGGFILFKDNMESVEQTVSFINDLKKANEDQVPLFFSVDEEGGKVSRIPEQELVIAPSAQEVGEKNDPELSFQIGRMLAKEVSALGFNMNYAPVMDVNSNPENPIIGSRAYGSTPSQVVKNGIPVMQGHQYENVIPVIKHFPGHGDTSVDSHKQLPVVNKSLKQLQKIELKPFRRAIQENADAIMVAHLSIPKLDSKNPSSLSKKIMTDLLREKLHFRGVVITDDLTMKGITNDYSVSEAALQSFKAGSDILLIAHGKDNIVSSYERIQHAVKTGEISEERLNESVYRILSLKSKYKVENNLVNPVDMKEMKEDMERILSNFDS